MSPGTSHLVNYMPFYNHTAPPPRPEPDPNTPPGYPPPGRMYGTPRKPKRRFVAKTWEAIRAQRVANAITRRRKSAKQARKSRQTNR